jgi:hypothetical protein
VPRHFLPKTMNTRILALGLVAFLALACSDSTSPPAPAAIVVTPSSVTLQAPGQTQQFSARVEDKSGRELTDVSVTWSSSDLTVATVDSAGIATGLKPGTVSIRASTPGVFGQASLAVNAAGPCDGSPLTLAPGESASLAPSGLAGCGFVLPAGSSGDRYRVAIIYAASDTIAGNVATVTVSATETLAAASTSGSASHSWLAPSPHLGSLGSTEGVGHGQDAAIVDPSLTEALAVADATEALHHRIRLAERELIRSLGPLARPLPDRRSTQLMAAPPAPTTASDVRSFTHPSDFTKCDVGSTIRALKIAESDLLVVYQDSTQNASTPMSVTHAESMLDYYQRYGKQVIDEYFGGVSDISGDGKVTVLVTPVVQEVQEGTAAFVWSGDFFPKTPQPGWPACPASNEMELIRFSLSTIQGISSGNYQALSTLVHEVKHVSSLYKGLIRGTLHPLWVEEGRAEIAGEMSSRLAWEATGGPAVNQLAVGANVGAFTPENYGVILRMARTTQYLSSQPNAVVVTPEGAQEGHSVYGSGWHFHRWLGDAYGNPAVRLGDAALFRTLNDSTTLSGLSGIRVVMGGKSWVDLLEEYALAVMQSGTPAPLGPRSFTTYNFPSMNRTFNYTGKPAGDYPWPVNVSPGNFTVPFGSFLNSGPVGPSGLRVFDLTSLGSGKGMEVRVEASRSPVRVVVLRVQ